MASAAQAERHTTRIEDPTLDEIRSIAREIRREWTPAEHRRRRDHAQTAQQRLFCLACSVAA